MCCSLINKNVVAGKSFWCDGNKHFYRKIIQCNITSLSDIRVFLE